MFYSLSVKAPISIKNTSLSKKKKKPNTQKQKQTTPAPKKKPKKQTKPKKPQILIPPARFVQLVECGRSVTHSAASLTTRKFHMLQTSTLGQQGRNQPWRGHGRAHRTCLCSSLVIAATADFQLSETYSNY